MKKRTVISSLTTAITMFFLIVTGAMAANGNWLLINEIYNDPANSDHEFIELYNNGPYELYLEEYLGLKLDDDITLTFPEVVSMQPDEYIILAHEPDDDIWEAIKALGVKVLGYSLHLGSSNGKIDFISTSCGAIVYNDTVTFENNDDESPWPQNGVGGYDEEIHSLELIDPDLDNDDGANWLGSTVEGGTPGVANSVVIP